MATESPLIHDGAQTTALNNMSLTASLAGYNSSGQWLAVKISGPRQIIAATSGGEAVYGILQNRPAAGQVADVGIMGVTKAMAGAQVTAPAALMTDTSGRLITATANNHRVAFAIESAAATGVIFTVALVPGLGVTST